MQSPYEHISMLQMKLDALRAKIAEKAAKETWADSLDNCDDGSVTVDDFSGGNQDDAYEGGFRSGETDFARCLLAEFFPA